MIMLNQLIRLARGEFVARMDGDDEMMPGRLSKQLQFMSQHADTDILGGSAMLVNREGQKIGKILVPETHTEIVATMPVKNPMYHSTFFYFSEELRL